MTADSAESGPATDTLDIPVSADAVAAGGEVVDDGVGDGCGAGGAVHVHGDEYGQRDVDGCDGDRSEVRLGAVGPVR